LRENASAGKEWKYERVIYIISKDMKLEKADSRGYGNEKEVASRDLGLYGG